MIDFRSMRPCGVCAALVPLAVGCKHWRVSAAARSEANAARRRARRAKQKADIEELRRQLTSRGQA